VAGDGSALAVVRRYADAWAAGDTATVVGLYADDIVLHYFGRSPLAGDHTGKAAALEVLGRLSNAVNRRAPAIHDVLGGEHHAAILAKERWGEGDGAIELNRVLLYHVRDGKLSECWIYDGDQPLVDRMLKDRLG
jgi:hypothetical protein